MGEYRHRNMKGNSYGKEAPAEGSGLLLPPREDSDQSGHRHDQLHVITNLEEVLQNEPSLGFRLIARMRFDGVNPAVMLPGVWGFCDCHGWQWNPRAIPDEHGCMAYDSH